MWCCGTGWMVSNGCSVLILPLTPEYEGTVILRNVDNNAFYVTTNNYNPNAETNALGCLVASASKSYQCVSTVDTTVYCGHSPSLQQISTSTKHFVTSQETWIPTLLPISTHLNVDSTKGSDWHGSSMIKVRVESESVSWNKCRFWLMQRWICLGHVLSMPWIIQFIHVAV